MAKQSAKSKGYRKTVQKKPFLTNKEIIELVAIIAVIVLAVVLFNVFYDDGLVRAGDVRPEDVVSTASQDAGGRYRKVAVANDIPGFTRSEPGEADGPKLLHNYDPDEEGGPVTGLSLSASYIPAARQYDRSLTSTTMADVTYSDVQQTSVSGHDAYVFAYTYDYYSEDLAAENEAETAEDEAEAAEAETDVAEADAESTVDTPASNSYNQAVCLYVDVDGYSLCFHVYRTGADESVYLPDDELVDFVLGYTDAFTIVEQDA